MTKGAKGMSRDPKSAYYDAGGIETLEVIKAKLTPEQYRGYLLGNAIKYTCRLNFKGCAERDAEKLAVYSAELAAIACKTGGECMKIQRYELLDLSSADGPSAMVTESEEGTYVLHADHAAEVAALKEEKGRLLREISDAGSWIADLEAEEGILRARVADQSAYILRLRKAIIDATNNAALLDSVKWVYGIDDSALQWPEELKEPANEG